MTLVLILKIFGWIFTLVPFITFFAISITMMKGAGEDDPTVQTLLLIGLTIFLMGVITLLITYLTNLF